MTTPKQKIKRATMLDVARESGISYQTVSRVINNHPSVAATTRERVLQVIQELNYRPNKAARSLAARQSRTLAVIIHSIRHYGPSQMVINIERSARDANYDLIFSSIDPATGEGVDAAIERLSQWSVDGILMIAPVVSAACDLIVEQCHSAPLVQIDIAPGTEVPSVIIDQRSGSRIATQHLIALGHHRIAEICGPLDWYGAVARRQGVQDALRQARLELAGYFQGDWTARSGFEGARALLQGEPFTGLVVANDQMALGAIRALHERGLSVPGDVSVVGFDDTPESAYYTPPLTTIRQDFAALGRLGLQYLIDIIQDPSEADGQRVIAPYLVVRESAAAPGLTRSSADAGKFGKISQDWPPHGS